VSVSIDTKKILMQLEGNASATTELARLLMDLEGKFGAVPDELSVSAHVYDALEREVMAKELQFSGVASIFNALPKDLRVMRTTIRRLPEVCRECGQQKPTKGAKP
jgi:hypothetical protein